MDDYVIIHGDRLILSDNIREHVDWALEQEWQKQKWRPIAALVSGSISIPYAGQVYDPSRYRLVENAWTHDHCEICGWSLSESDRPEKGIGYTIDNWRWICTECYEVFIENSE